MNSTLGHRGPDDEGTFVDDDAHAALGATRLSIIDVEGGHQPVASEDGDVVAVLNGEIYNHRALAGMLRERGHRFGSAVDTEVLVHLYEEYGDGLVHAIDGMYAFAIWDTKRRRLLLARDRFGEKPLFYSEREGTLTFASELTAVLAGIGGSHSVDRAAVDAFFVLGYVPGPASMVDGVSQLPAGHTLAWEEGRSEVAPYWSPPAIVPNAHVDMHELLEETEQLLLESVTSRLIADVPLGVFLSGGLDSTLVASFASEASSKPVETFTVGYDVGKVSEAEPARAAAEALGTDHHELILEGSQIEPLVRSVYSRIDQPNADQALLAFHAVSRFARERVKVVVGGEGADELFGGYPRYKWLALADRADGRLPDSVGRAVAAALERLPLRGRSRRLAHVIEPQSAFSRHFDWISDDRPGSRQQLYGPKLDPAFSSESLAERMSFLRATNGIDTARVFMLQDQLLWLPDDVLAKADRASMLASLEVRTPFLEPRLAELAAGVPTRVHLSHGGKALLRGVLQRRLPDLRRGRGKTAFRVPAGEWLRGPLSGLLQEQISSSALYTDGWIDRTAADRILRDHLEARHDRTGVLWTLMVLAFWFDAMAKHLGG